MVRFRMRVLEVKKFSLFSFEIKILIFFLLCLFEIKIYLLISSENFRIYKYAE